MKNHFMICGMHSLIIFVSGVAGASTKYPGVCGGASDLATEYCEQQVDKSGVGQISGCIVNSDTLEFCIGLAMTQRGLRGIDKIKEVQFVQYYKTAERCSGQFGYVKYADGAVLGLNVNEKCSTAYVDGVL